VGDLDGVSGNDSWSLGHRAVERDSHCNRPSESRPVASVLVASCVYRLTERRVQKLRQPAGGTSQWSFDP
jgi:hypothetical protein